MKVLLDRASSAQRLGEAVHRLSGGEFGPGVQAVRARPLRDPESV